ncbi:MAG: hypothetical protein IT206_05600 [Fimbriimonadaceae bacterium]|nr:hypothetical protein [Fimbriimonadaceae bacterium]
MKLVSVILFFAVVASGLSKDTPISQAEADHSIRKVCIHLKQVLGLPDAKVTVSTSSAPLNREQFIDRLSVLFSYIKPKIRQNVHPLSLEIKGLASGLSEPREKTLRSLVNFGLVSPDSLLVKTNQTRFTPREFGQILGGFLARAMDITMVLDPKYSPELMPD